MPEADFQVGLNILREFDSIGTEKMRLTRGQYNWAEKTRLMDIGMVLGLPEMLVQIVALTKKGEIGSSPSLMYSAEKMTADGKNIINLEDKHLPDLRENISSVLLSLDMSMSGTCALSGCLYAFGGNTTSGWVTLSSAAIWVGFKIYEKIKASKYIKQRPELERMLNYMNGMLNARDLTMARNISGFLDSSSNQILAVVGKAHVPGMTKILKEQYGFEVVPLE